MKGCVIMKTSEDLKYDYESYIEYMKENGSTSSAYTLQEWIKWQFGMKNITKQQYNYFFDSEGYFKESEHKCCFERGQVI